ncbi:MAG: anaerobic ribonucleoside-triphosphate reductase activating protein [Bacteroidaceae bacterium]|nr:anaerobic ribonucleoside-triphosphate reductase activating protein [Bacteroidaceae bacterium]
MKYVNTGVVFQEIPGETTLSINISACPCHCPGCHSKYLWDDIGVELTESILNELIDRYMTDITCICFMGGDADPAEVNHLAAYVKENYPQIKTAWYSGRIRIHRDIEKANFNYIKVGPFLEHLGPLNKETTNQRLYKVTNGEDLQDITCLFWKKK